MSRMLKLTPSFLLEQSVSKECSDGSDDCAGSSVLEQVWKGIFKLPMINVCRCYYVEAVALVELSRDGRGFKGLDAVGRSGSTIIGSPHLTGR